MPQTPGAKPAHKHATTTNGAERERGYFIAGTRPEPRDYPATGSASRLEAREQFVPAEIVTLAELFFYASNPCIVPFPMPWTQRIFQPKDGLCASILELFSVSNLELGARNRKDFSEVFNAGAQPCAFQRAAEDKRN